MAVIKYVKANELVDAMLSLRNKYGDIRPKKCSPQGNKWHITLERRRGGLTYEEKVSIERELRNECKKIAKARQMKLNLQEEENGKDR